MAALRDPDNTLARILAVTAEQMRRHGFKATSLAEIVKQAKISKGALYHHFANKQELGYAVFSEIFMAENTAFWQESVIELDDPIFVANIDNQSKSVSSLTPYYQQIEQTGLDVQATKGSMLWKLEAITVAHKGNGRNTALVGGFEYTFYGIAQSDIDLGLLVEYQFDDRSGIRATSNQNDLALGMRYAFNDVEGTELLAALSVDLDNQSRFYSIEASRRLNDDWSLSVEARLFSNMAIDDPGHALRDDDYMQIELRRFF